MPPTNTTDAAAAATTLDAAAAATTAEGAHPPQGRRAVPAPPPRQADASAVVSAAEHAAALARVAELEAQLGTALADRDAAVEQLRGAVPSSDPRRVFEDLARRFVVATEVQAILALAATRTGRDASTLRELAAGYLAQTTSAR